MTRGAWARTTVGAYHLMEMVGAGGMGEVYRAVHLPTRRTVAVKVLTGAGAAPNVAARFRNEARVQAAMSHANIATLHELIEVGGTPCIVMEFVEGETLDQLLRRRGSIPVHEALAAASQVVAAVGYLHRRGVIHRDIKASNAKIDATGLVKLLDFGIAKDPDSPALTRTGNVIGTLQSLAPEQLEHGRCDHRTDIWALGVLLHELLTSHHPFVEDGMHGITDRIRAGRFRLPSRVNPSLPTGVDRIVARCLRVDPAHRYQSCEAMLDDIRMVAAAPSGERERAAAGSWLAMDDVMGVARSRGMLGAAILSGVLAIALLGWALFRPYPLSTAGDVVPSRAAVGGDVSGERPVTPAVQPTAGATREEVRPTAAPVREVTVNALNGSADVYQDGRYVGRTPYLLREPIGTPVSLVLRRPGYEDAQVHFDVTEGRRAYTIPLRQQAGGSGRGGSGGDGATRTPEHSSPELPARIAWLGLPVLGWLRRGKGGAGGGDGGVGVTGETGIAKGGGGPDDVPGESEMLIGIATDTGCVREGNEDSVRVVRPAGVDALARRGLLAVVCDGMGGHAAGETASRLAADVVSRLYAVDAADPGAALARAVRHANRAVYDAARSDARLAGMGTTCTAVVLRGGRAWCAHVGDSRCYLIRDGQMYLMTEDHSAVMELVRKRSISRDDARQHPDRNVVSRAVGSHRDVNVSVWAKPFAMRPGDRMLLSSDGLHDLVSEDAIRAAVLESSPQRACQRLVELAREQGAPDNVSVVLLELPMRRPPAAAVGATRELPALANGGMVEGGEARP